MHLLARIYCFSFHITNDRTEQYSSQHFTRYIINYNTQISVRASLHPTLWPLYSYDSGCVHICVCRDLIEREYTMITKADTGVEMLRYFHEYERHASHIYDV